MQYKNPTKLRPAQLGEGGHLARMASRRTQLQQLQIQHAELGHQIKLMKLSGAPAPKKASAPKNQGAVK
jgi:hypothetical protein